MPLVENLREFFAEDFNGENVAITGIGTILGTFDKEFAASFDIEGDLPVFFCIEADVLSAAHGTEVIRSGTTYHVVGMQKDGSGLIALVLEEQ